jgi:hypothetical protein
MKNKFTDEYYLDLILKIKRKREETVRNRNKSYGFDLEEQLSNILSQQLSKSINEEFVKNVLKEFYLSKSGIYINNII